MKMKLFLLSLGLLTLTTLSAQKGKVQSAWRNLSDYEETVKDGSPNIDYLTKANEAINLALTNEETKNKAKTHAYKLRIAYAFFKYKLKAEIATLEAGIGDKDERLITAYGNVDLTDFEIASDELNKIKELDPKFLETIQSAIVKGVSSLDEEELKFALAIQEMKMECSNIASGKYKASKYEVAASYFYKTALINSLLYNVKDTISFNNACIAASKSKDTEKIIYYNNKMMEASIAGAYNYELVYTAQLAKLDSNAAMETLRKGRQAFPDDAGLLTQETSLFLSKGKQEQALANLKISVQKDPKNALYYFIIGQIYENMADPKDNVSGQELDKPKNFEELFSNAETNYMKAIELCGSNKELLYNSNFNLGAMYNNYGGYLANHKSSKITDLAKNQKENEAKAQIYYKKAIPYLEKALELKTDDKNTMSALRKLYLLTGNDAKAKEMNERLK